MSLKKTEPILLRLPAPLCARLNLAAEARGGRRYRQDIIRAAIEARLEELEVRSGHVSAEIAAALAHCRALGVDPLAALAAAAESALSTPSSVVRPLSSGPCPPSSVTRFPLSGQVTPPTKPAA